ncbi:MAG: capsular biosynthesis protein [Proteobacteria bacterium]|nr:capsular biosynthesis protein [Pseudomonadota bacterium]
MSTLVPAGALHAVLQLLTWLRPATAAAYPGQVAPTMFRGTGTAGAAAAAPDPIPRRIWSYWNGATLEPVVAQCVENWRLQCPDYRIEVLNAGNLDRFVAPGDLPPGFAALAAPKQADWLRLYLVRRHGGFWLDASIVLTESLDWLRVQQQAQGSEFVGFFLQGFTHDARCPVVESWAFGAPAQAPFVTAWQQEFHHALIAQGSDAYLAELRGQPFAAELLQGITDPEYLLIHVAAQRVLRRGNDYLLSLLCAEDTAYFYQKALFWKWYLLYPRLCLMAMQGASAPLVKLRGGERRHFSELLAQHGGARRGSLWQRACSPGQL